MKLNEGRDESGIKRDDHFSEQRRLTRYRSEILKFCFFSLQNYPCAKYFAPLFTLRRKIGSRIEPSLATWLHVWLHLSTWVVSEALGQGWKLLQLAANSAFRLSREGELRFALFKQRMNLMRPRVFLHFSPITFRETKRQESRR